VAWEIRKNGCRYFYLSERQPDGNVRRRYLGYGLRAEVESIRLERRKAQREELLREKKKTAELEGLTTHCVRKATTVLEAHLFAEKFHNPEHRGWRRRNEMIRPADTEQQDTRETTDALAKDTSELNLEELVSLARHGDRDAAYRIRNILSQHPNLFGPLGQLSSKVQAKWIREITGQDLFEKEMVLHATAELRQSLIAESNGTTLERLLVEQVVTTFLQLNYHEQREANAPASDLRISEHRLKKIESAFKRHLKSLEALTTTKALLPKKMVEKPTPHLEAANGEPQPDRESTENRLEAYFERSREAVSTI